MVKAMLRNAIAVLAAALVLAAPARALAQDAGMQATSARSLMPSVPVTIKYGHCPVLPASCYYADTDTMWVAEGEGTLDFDWQHEMGHAVDDQRMDAGERHAFSCLPAMYPRRPSKPRCGQPWAPRLAEMFADAYANCATGKVPSDEIFFIYGYGYTPTTDRRHLNACRFIRRAMR